MQIKDGYRFKAVDTPTDTICPVPLTTLAGYRQRGAVLLLPHDPHVSLSGVGVVSISVAAGLPGPRARCVLCLGYCLSVEACFFSSDVSKGGRDGGEGTLDCARKLMTT